jgi:hypothetical protein
VRSTALAGAGGLLFALAATLNAGGYRYGASDQAFYIPAILRHVDPRLFPRDAALIESQARLFVLDEVAAWLLAWLPVGLETWFLAGYLVTLALLGFGLTRLGLAWLASPWSVAAFVAASALRHRIAKTGANTLEGYFHPRQLAFAFGVLGLVAVMRRRPPLALAAIVAAGLVHPTTAVFFAGWIGIALLVEEPAWRRRLAAAGALGVVAAALLLIGGFLPIARMDAIWVATLADKDYVFPTAWRAETWALNLLYPIVIAATFAARRRRGLVRPGETGVVAGCLALVALFVVALPFIAARVTIAVQLQVSRVFWMADLLAVLSIVWWLAEAGRRVHGSRGIGEQGSSPALRPRRPVLVFAVLAAAALARGAYVLGVEHPGRPLVQAGLARDSWHDAAAWIAARTPAATHVLADPDHAWRYGTSLRVSARRDVFLENVKDGSIGMYDRRVAMRVLERRQALGEFASLGPDAVRSLAARYDLGVLLVERPLPFDELYRNDRFYVYRLQP